MDQSSSNSPIHQIEYSNGGSSPLSNQSFNGSNTMLTIKTSTLSNMQTNGSSSSIASLETNHLNSKHSEAPKRLCLVCGDTSSGFHYGVSSCEACKAFFKRTIQGNIEYSCPAQGECEINKRRRKACQACRFQKCLRMGMLKEGVRLDRVRGGRQKYRRNGESPYLVNGLNCNNSTANSNSVYFNVLNNMRTGQQNPLISALLNCEPEPNSVGSNGNDFLNGNSDVDIKPFSGEMSNRMIALLSELVDKELVSTIVWAKQIPGFTDLELNDQMRLLQSSWAEILALSLSYRTQQIFNSNSSTPNTPTPCNSISITNGNSKVNLTIPNKLVFTSDFIMEQSHAIECKAEEMFGYCLQLQKRMVPLAISKQEYVLLKSLLLMNVDIELEDNDSVEKLKANVLSALQEVIAHGKPPSNALQHLNELLLCLPLIRQVDVVIRKYWNQVRLDNKVPMNKLFIEMLESNYSTIAFFK